LNFLLGHVLDYALEEQRQKIIDRGAKDGKTIEIESLRRTLERQKTAYTGLLTLAEATAFSFALV